MSIVNRKVIDHALRKILKYVNIWILTVDDINEIVKRDARNADMWFYDEFKNLSDYDIKAIVKNFLSKTTYYYMNPNQECKTCSNTVWDCDCD